VSKMDNWFRKHDPRNKQPEKVEIVYRCKDKAERDRRVARIDWLVGTPFVSLPGVTDHKAILFTSKDGKPIPAEAVEMVFNDMLLMDAVSNWGIDGPLYKDTLDELHQEVYSFALERFAQVPIPEKVQKDHARQTRPELFPSPAGGNA
jgi:hypothetical protein